jgi:hypothetical protein
MFLSYHEIEINNLKHEIWDRESKVSNITLEQDHLKSSLSHLFQFAGIELKGSKKKHE